MVHQCYFRTRGNTKVGVCMCLIQGCGAVTHISGSDFHTTFWKLLTPALDPVIQKWMGSTSVFGLRLPLHSPGFIYMLYCSPLRVSGKKGSRSKNIKSVWFIQTFESTLVRMLEVLVVICKQQFIFPKKKVSYPFWISLCIVFKLISAGTNSRSLIFFWNVLKTETFLCEKYFWW